MSERSATATIKGYLYQFDLTILEILKLENPDDSVIVEGIEDIDIWNPEETTVVQCKYHEKTEYNHSVIKKPIQWMVRHYKNVLDGTALSVKYKYFGHFKSGHEKCPKELTLDFLKKDLLTSVSGKEDKKIETKLHEDLDLSDDDLKCFIDLLAININAPSYKDQQKSIFKKLVDQESLDCRDFKEAEGFFYNSALFIVADLAIQQEKSLRKIIKSEFIERINRKQLFFNKWYLHSLGKAKYLKYIKDEYFKGMNISPYSRLFLIDVKGRRVRDVKQLILKITSKFTKHKKTGKSFCPYIYLHNINNEDLQEIKTQLRDEGHNLIDGHDFLGSEFYVESLRQDVTYHNKIKVKFINRADQIDEVLGVLNKKTKEVYQFHTSDSFYKTEREDIKFVSIELESIMDMEKII